MSTHLELERIAAAAQKALIKIINNGRAFTSNSESGEFGRCICCDAEPAFDLGHPNNCEWVALVEALNATQQYKIQAK